MAVGKKEDKMLTQGPQRFPSFAKYGCSTEISVVRVSTQNRRIEMNRNLMGAASAVRKADALLYAFEKTYLDHVGSDCDWEMSNRAAYAFYAIWDAVREASENLDRLEGDERVVDVILAARKNGSTLTR